MGLSNELISQFAKLVKNDKKQDSGTIVYGKIIVGDKGQKYVLLDGNNEKNMESWTPLTEADNLTAVATDANDGDRVAVTIKNHIATITENITSPAAKTVSMQAEKAYFKQLVADEAIINKLTAANISVADLIAKDADIENLIAEKATITDLIAKKIDTDVLVADDATIEKLKANNIKVLNLFADQATIDMLKANNATIGTLLADKADIKWANIDFANIDKATFQELYSKSGIIQYVTSEDQTVTGELIGVKISGDLIKANTLKADSLILKGEDGLYYQLNINALGEIAAEEFEKEELESKLHGSVIIAKSITADKISVSDLVAFGATIGGFMITDDAIYSGVKESVDNTNTGSYLDKNGQFVAGDTNNYVKIHRPDRVSSFEEIEPFKIISTDILVNYIIDNGYSLENTTDIMVHVEYDPYGYQGTLVKDDVFYYFLVQSPIDIGMEHPYPILGDMSDFSFSVSYTDGRYTLERISQEINSVFDNKQLFISKLIEKSINVETTKYLSTIVYMDDPEIGYTIDITTDNGQTVRFNEASLTDCGFKAGFGGGIFKIKTTTDYGDRYEVDIKANNIILTSNGTDSNLSDELKDYKDRLSGVESKVALKMDTDAVTVEIEKIKSDGVSQVKTKTGYEFNDEGMTVVKDNSPTKTVISDDGMTVSKRQEFEQFTEMLSANSAGVNAVNLKASNYIIINEESRLQPYIKNGKKRTACFWIGG